MSFNSKVFNTLSAIPGITDIVPSTRIHGVNLPDNYDKTKEHIVISSRMDEGISALEEDNVLEIHTLYVVLFGIDTDSLETLEDAVRAGVDEYSDANFRDINFQGDIYAPDYDQGTYEKALQYRVIFENI